MKDVKRQFFSSKELIAMMSGYALEHQRVTVLGDERLLLASCGVFLGTVEVTFGDNTIGVGVRRVEGVGETVLLNESV